MSSDLQSAVEALLLNNYITLIGIVIVGYDYVLMLPREIDYVWTLDLGLNGIRHRSLFWSLLGYNNWAHWFFFCTRTCGRSVLYLVSCWAFPVFICAADFVMILRVYSMWNRSRRILYVLLFIYVLQIIVSMVLPAIYNSSTTYFTASIVQILDFSFCSGTFSSAMPAYSALYSALPRFAVSAILLVLAVIRTAGEVVEMYKATKQWQPNRYITQLMKDGIYYFFINTFYNVLQVTTVSASDYSPLAVDVLGVALASLLCTAMPRFIIGVRELYDRDLRDRWQEIDAGFGVLSQATPSENEDVSAVSLGDVTQGEDQVVQGDAHDSEEIQLEVVGEGLHQV